MEVVADVDEDDIAEAVVVVVGIVVEVDCCCCFDGELDVVDVVVVATVAVAGELVTEDSLVVVVVVGLQTNKKKQSFSIKRSSRLFYKNIQSCRCRNQCVRRLPRRFVRILMYVSQNRILNHRSQHVCTIMFW